MSICNDCGHDGYYTKPDPECWCQMSEKYDDCSSCRGMGVINVQDRQPDGSYGPKRRIECLSCWGTGTSGDASSYRENENRREPEYLKPKAPKKDIK